MKKPLLFGLLFFILTSNAHAMDDWKQICKRVKTMACMKYCDLKQKNEFVPLQHASIAAECSYDYAQKTIKQHQR